MRFSVQKYSAWWWGIVDNSITPNPLFVRKADGKLLLFKSKAEAEIWCKQNTEEITYVEN